METGSRIRLYDNEIIETEKKNEYLAEHHYKV